MDKESFYDILSHSGYFDTECSEISFRNEEKLYSFLDDIIQNDKRVLVYGDYDLDGMSCSLIVRDIFNTFGLKNFQIHKYWRRTHLIDTKAVSEAVNGGYEYIMIMDAGTNQLEKINNMTECGLKVILIDHHKCLYDYDVFPENCAIVNSVIENRYRYKENKTPYIVSAGSLTYLVFRRYLVLRGLKDTFMSVLASTACYAVVSLYSDCIDMGNPYNRIVYSVAVGNQEFDIPLIIRSVMSEYQILCKRFITFTFAPKINAAFRTEQFEVLNNILVENKTLVDNHRSTKELFELHSQSVQLIDKVTPLVAVEEFNNFVLGNLNSVNSLVNVEENKLYNYTGLIASRIGEKFGKPCVVLCGLSSKIKGSFRDNYSRDFLGIFKKFSDSEGHGAAFGIKLTKFGYNDFHENLKKLDEDSLLMEYQKPMVIVWTSAEPDLELFEQIAMYNEFSGVRFPTVYLTVYLDSEMKEYQNDYGYSYRWDGIYIKSKERLDYFKDVIVCPTVGKTTSLRVM